MAKVYRSSIQSYVTGDYVGGNQISRGENMMNVFMRNYRSRFGKPPLSVITKRKNGIKSLHAAAPGGWLVMFFEGYEKSA